uniref:DUF6385 domain-containing protein n=1 Tax=Clostridium hydrogeniformans TaxID=349933 RepID=UPI0004858979
LTGNTDSVRIFDTVTIRALSGTTDSIKITDTIATRPLAGNTDSVRIFDTVTIRALSGTTDSIKIADTVATRLLTGSSDSVRIFDTVTIRALSGATDSVRISDTVATRALSAVTDSITLGSRTFATDNALIVSGTPTQGNVLLKDNSDKIEYSYYIYNTGGAAVTVSLQISPTTADAYFMNDSSTALIPSGHAVLVPKYSLQYSRLAFNAAVSSSVHVYYNAKV